MFMLGSWKGDQLQLQYSSNVYWGWGWAGPSTKGVPLYLFSSIYLGKHSPSKGRVFGLCIYFMGVMDKLPVPGKICKQADLGNTTLHPLMGGRDKGKKPFPAHSGSATLHAGPDTEISVMSFSFAFYQEIIQCAYRKLLGKGDEFM